jgi:hypothetical protein
MLLRDALMRAVWWLLRVAQFFRITDEVDPSTVRPLPVLERAFAAVKARYWDDEAYPYLCSQLKSIRQDLTLQNIKIPFTVAVYEEHARIALEFGDLFEFNQCCTRLVVLYDEGLPGSVQEFAAYRLLQLTLKVCGTCGV